MQQNYSRKTDPIQKATKNTASSVLDTSSQSEALQRKADMASNAAQREEAPRPNNTGMPDNLKTGIESLSGFSMDDVRVHYNSSKPATVQALAYTQGTDIHVAPGQEKHLPHEAWHVAQQMAGRVSPTTNINGMPVNDNAGLEHEADVMGEKAVQCKGIRLKKSGPKKIPLSTESVQRFTITQGTEEVTFNTLRELKEWIGGDGILTSFSSDELKIIEEIRTSKPEYDEICLKDCTCVLDVYNAYQQALKQKIQIGDYFYNCDTIGDLKTMLRLKGKTNFFMGGKKLDFSSKKTSSLLQSIWSNTFFDNIIIKDFTSFDDIENLVSNYSPIVLVKKYQSNPSTPGESIENIRILESDSIYCYTHLTCDSNIPVGSTSQLIANLKIKRQTTERKDFFPDDTADKKRVPFENRLVPLTERKDTLKWVPFEKRLVPLTEKKDTLDSFKKNVHITLETNRYALVMERIFNFVKANINQTMNDNLDFAFARDKTDNEIKEIIKHVKRNEFIFDRNVNCNIAGGGVPLKVPIDQIANNAKTQNEDSLLKAISTINDQSRDSREKLKELSEKAKKLSENAKELSGEKKELYEKKLKEKILEQEKKFREREEELRGKESTSKFLRQTGDNYIEKIRSDTTAFAAYLTNKKMDLSKIDRLEEILKSVK